MEPTNNTLGGVLGSLFAARDQIKADLDIIEGMIALAAPPASVPVVPPRKRSTAKRASSRKTSSRKATAKRPQSGVSQLAKDRVLAAVKQLPEPGTSAEVTVRLEQMERGSGIAKLGQSTVSKALVALADSGAIRKAGIKPKVKGKRPMYAAWPSDAVRTSGQQNLGAALDPAARTEDKLVEQPV